MEVEALTVRPHCSFVNFGTRTGQRRSIKSILDSQRAASRRGATLHSKEHASGTQAPTLGPPKNLPFRAITCKPLSQFRSKQFGRRVRTRHSPVDPRSCLSHSVGPRENCQTARVYFLAAGGVRSSPYRGCGGNSDDTFFSSSPPPSSSSLSSVSARSFVRSFVRSASPPTLLCVA